MSEPSRTVPSGMGGLRPTGAGGAGHAQLARLFRLVMLLQSEPHPNARRLADLCEVSRRTIHRDLETLEEAGLRVEYLPEKQGYALHRGTFVAPSGLSEHEATAILVLARQWGGGESLGLAGAAREGALKIVQGLAAEVRERVLAAAEPFRSGESHPEASPDRAALHRTVLASVGHRRQLRLWYHAPGLGEVGCTKFGPYRLVLRGGHWYMIGRSSVERRVVVVGLPWVERATLTDDPYTIPPRFKLDRFLAQAWGVEKSLLRYQVWVRFSPVVAPELVDLARHRGERRVGTRDGGVDVHIVVDGLDEILRWILGFGDQIEVICPAELRQRLHEVASRVARTHEPTGGELPGACESA